MIDDDASELEELPVDFTPEVAEEDITSTDSHVHLDRNGGKPGFVSFYGLERAREDAGLPFTARKNQSSLLWFAGPAVLVASFILPSLYLRKIISTIFEDSLLTGERLSSRSFHLMYRISESLYSFFWGSSLLPYLFPLSHATKPVMGNE